MWNWLTKSVEARKKITLKNVRNFIEAKERQFRVKWKIYNMTELEYTQHVVDERLKAVIERSPICISQGYCKHCGCDMPDKLYETDACDAGCYGEWVKKEDYV